MDSQRAAFPPGRTTNLSGGSMRASPGDRAVAEFVSSAPQVPPLHRTTRLAYLLALLAAVTYAAFILQPSNRGDIGPYLVLLGAEIILIGSAALTIWTILAGDGLSESDAVKAQRSELTSGRWSPSVDIFITVYGEPIELVTETIKAALAVTASHRTLVCDDGCSPEVEWVARSLGAEYLPRRSSEGAKAGNINYALAHSDADFVAIFDADHIPHPDFLVVTLAHFVDESVAFVQSPQHYRNGARGPIARSGQQSQRIFYELVCPGKNAFNAAFHVGTNAVFRRDALDEVGGIFTESNSEDIWTSLRLHRLGWSSVYVADVLALGLAPETMQQHLDQQFRWASGSFEVLLKGRPFTDGRLTLDQRLQYLTPSLHYLQSISMLFYLLLPVLFLLFGWAPLAVDSSVWLTRFLPFYVLTQLALFLQMGSIGVWPTVLALAAAPVHVRAFISVAIGRGRSWKVTNTNSTADQVLHLMRDQLILAMVLASGLVVGVVAFADPSQTWIALGLCLFNLILLVAGIVVADTDRRRRRRDRPAGRLGAPAVAGSRR